MNNAVKSFFDILNYLKHIHNYFNSIQQSYF